MQRQQRKLMKKQNAYNLMGPVATDFCAAQTGTWRLEYPQVEYDACVCCGICAKYCPCDVITINKGNKECIKFDFTYCKGCGICANECPKHCIEMVKEGFHRNV
jgi:pyruvate ferredoxin oxidoreductase delta subunit